VAKFSLKDQNIIITSNEPWEGMWFSKHNYAYELSKYNRVIFINPQSPWKFKNIFGCHITTTPYNKDLTILNYNNFLPILNKFLFHINDYLVSRRLKHYFRKNNYSNIIFWAFDPFRLCNPERLGASLSIYHSVDPYNFKPYGEISLCKNVDVIFCIGTYLMNQYTPFNKPLYLIPHGISTDEFSINNNDYTPEIPYSDYGLYIGSIGNLNYQLIEKMLKQHPQTQFLFVGELDDEIGRQLFSSGKYSNLHHHEAVDFKKLKYFINKSKFCLVPKSYLTSSPHKILQYLAFGKPVFGAYMENVHTAKSIVYMSKNDDEVLLWLKEFMQKGEDPELSVKRINYAKEHTFEKIFQKVEQYLSN
jgi:glycosyltransferase involved in cell wall biosynthesis